MENKITSKDIKEAIKSLEENSPWPKCPDCNTEYDYIILGVPGMHCKCVGEELVKMPYVQQLAKDVKEMLEVKLEKDCS